MHSVVDLQGVTGCFTERCLTYLKFLCVWRYA